MLDTLRNIIEEVNSSINLHEALKTVVRRVRAALSTSAATIFLIDDKHQQFIMVATDGLNPAMVGKLRVGLDDGLIGLVGRREEPINLDNAPMHPNFFHHSEAGEEKYFAFLGVPIIHHRRLFGVLTIQQDEQRHYGDSEEAFLVTLSAQLAGIIAHAHATGELAQLELIAKTANPLDEATIGGIGSAAGVGIGQAVVVFPLADLDAVPDRQIDAEEIDHEIEQIDRALSAAQNDMRQLSKRFAATLPSEEHALFDVYVRILDSDSIYQEIVTQIRKGNWAQGALRIVIHQHINSFKAMQDEYLRERAFDFLDLGRRVLAHLQAFTTTVNEWPERTILVGEEVTAAALAEVPPGQLAGVVSAEGSSNSHVAILARALGVPTVMGAAGARLGDLQDKLLIVDGYYGQVYVNPSPSLLLEFQALMSEERELDATLAKLRDEPAQTPDGLRMTLMVNTGLAGDSGLSLSVGAEGVGLFRTEVPFMTRERFPSEDEQHVIYRQLLKAFAPRPVIMRTLDIGGDKALPYFPVEEDNPFLGWRGIRITLDHPELFLVQVRAMLRAHAEMENLKILLPMVSGVGEVDEACNLIKQAYLELLEEGFAFEKPEIGAMIEVPSAVYQARSIAKRVDFLSVGSNDLTQYLLAVDRNNSRVAGLYDDLHPAVLQALLQIVDGAHSEGKPISICGEMTSDPVAVILLLAMGFDSLSMNPSSLPRVKWVVRNFTVAFARKLLSEVLAMDNAALIRFHLEKALTDAGLGDLIRAGKR